MYAHLLWLSSFLYLISCGNTLRTQICLEIIAGSCWHNHLPVSSLLGTFVPPDTIQYNSFFECNPPLYLDCIHINPSKKNDWAKMFD